MTSINALSRHFSNPATPNADLLDDMANTAIDALDLLGPSATPLPEALSLGANSDGGLLPIDSTAYFGDGDDPIHYGRVTRLRGDDGLQSLDIACFPALDSGWPILGIKMVVSPDGIDSVVLDAFDVAGNPQHPHLHDVLQNHRRDLHSRHPSSPIPGWGSAVFSDNAIFIESQTPQSVSVTDFALAFHDIFDAYLGDDLSNPLPLHLRTRAQQARRNYLYSHGHHEPAHAVLERIGDAQWAEQFVFDYLYPTWLYDGDQRPSWA